MELTRYEQETIINYNEEERTASIYTHNRALRRKLDRLALERPGDCRPGSMTHEGQAAEYIVPKAWLKVTPKRQLTEAESAQRREAVQRANLARNRTGQPQE